MIVQRQGKGVTKKMFKWIWAAKEEYYISVSKKFKEISSKVRNERK